MKALSSEPIPTSLERVVAEFREAVRDAKCAVDYLDELDRRLVRGGLPVDVAEPALSAARKDLLLAVRNDVRHQPAGVAVEDRRAAGNLDD